MTSDMLIGMMVADGENFENGASGGNPQGIASLEAVAACLADISAAGCAPDDRFEP